MNSSRPTTCPGRQIDLVGMHGQTVLHERPQPMAARAAPSSSATANGWPPPPACPSPSTSARPMLRPAGRGRRSRRSTTWPEPAPPGLAAPLAVLNVGGVANVTFWSGRGPDHRLRHRPRQRHDRPAGPGPHLRLASTRAANMPSVGRVDDIALNVLLGHPYFEASPAQVPGPFRFLARTASIAWSLEDACRHPGRLRRRRRVKLGLRPHGDGEPTEVIVCGGGRHNPAVS